MMVMLHNPYVELGRTACILLCWYVCFRNPLIELDMDVVVFCLDASSVEGWLSNSRSCS